MTEMTESDDEDVRTWARQLFGKELDASPAGGTNVPPEDDDNDRAVARTLFRPTPNA